MSIKVPQPDNPIILEGLWGLGKSQLAHAYSHKYNYELVSEPLHTNHPESKVFKDLSDWYVKAHKKQEFYLNKSLPVIMERSILSTFAFLYALKRPVPHHLYISSFQHLIENKKILVVYLKFNEDFSSWEHEDLKRYSDDIQEILTKKEVRARYQEWYEKILPQKYGILPFQLRVSKRGIRRETNKLINDIYLALACNRIAQINTVCFKKASIKEEMQILILKRSINKGNFFQTVTGGIHIGESPLNAAIRETSEELGIPKEAINPFWTPLTYSFMGDDGYELDEYVFGCEINDPSFIHISKEHDSFEWVNIDQAKQMVKFENNKNAINEVYKKIGQLNEELP